MECGQRERFALRRGKERRGFEEERGGLSKRALLGMV